FVQRHRSMTKVWLLLSYCQIEWRAVINLFVNVYEYLYTDKYKDKQEFVQELGELHAPIIGRVLSQCGIILIMYKFFKSLEPPKMKLKIKLGKMATELKTE
ncbi:hypothetical protein KR222_001217, partial [Zaprionus bogoriensis]